jgi:polysaccharide biosynthesis protein PelG
MAGIGFALKKLSSQDNLASRSLAAGHAILISSGPWIVIMVGLALLSNFVTPILGSEETKIFNVLVIYSFALSLVITAPIALEATLRVSALLFERQFQDVQRVYLGALGIATFAALVSSCIVFLGIVQLSGALALAAIVCVMQVTWLWLAMAFVAAIKQYGVVTLAFALGLSCSVVLGSAAAAIGHGPGGMLLGFSAGLCVSFAILNFLILQTFPGTLAPVATLWQRLRQARLQSPVFVVAGIASALAVWVDKLIVWHSAEAETVGGGLLYAPRYDSPMFIAYLSIVPVMSVLVIWLETTFFDNYRHYRDIVHSGGTLRQIEEQRRRLTHDTIDAVFSAFLIQLAVSGALAIASPLLASLLSLPYEALSVLRLALAGAAFHFLFQACCGVILFVQYGRGYLWLQGAFLLLNAAMTAAMLTNPDYLGMGYVLAAMLSAIFAYAVMLRTLRTLNRLTFVVNNPSISA